MQQHLFKAWLWFLRTLIYTKRAVVWLFRGLGFAGQKVETVYDKTLGFRFYKLGFSFKKHVERWKLPRDKRLFDVLGRRGTLQVLLFIIAFSLLIPYSKLYTHSAEEIPGRSTILYRLVGPTDEIAEIEEVNIDLNTPVSQGAPSWREGAFIGSTPAPVTTEPQEIAGLSAGGSALSKPTIISGAVPQAVEAGGFVAKRTSIVEHVVQPGEVIGKIAEQYGVSVATILWANNLSVRSYIRPGDRLKILPTDGIIHTVKKGETVSKIAQLYKANQDAIVTFNRMQRDGADIVVGEQLIIPGGAKPTVVVYNPPVRRDSALSSIAAPPPSIDAPAGLNYLWPTSVQRITQYYGLRHTGVDIAGPVGSPLYAARSGRVVKSTCGWNGGYGCYIIIDHGSGVQTLYGHASKLYVSAGDDVEQGQTIALMGSTGRSTGPHVHFEVRVNGRRANPLQYVRK